MEDSIEYTVQLHEAGPDLKVRLKALFNYMQSSADRNSKILGTSVSLMSEKNLTWVYTRFYAIVERYPELYEKVFCRTWRSEILNGLASREFILKSGDGEVLVRATSTLALIDKTTRKSVPIPDDIILKLEHQKELSINFSGDIVEYKDGFDYIFDIKTRYDDIDINGHMNNASYADVLFESAFAYLEKPMNLRSIDILFKGEVNYRDELECGVKSLPEAPGEFYHRLFNRTKGRVSARAKTVWIAKT